MSIVRRQGPRERALRAIVYGAKLKVEEGAKVTSAQHARRVGSLHLLPPHRNRRHRPVQGPAGRRPPSTKKSTKSAGLSRLVVADSSDEKASPAILIKAASGNKRYLMPSRANLMVRRRRRGIPWRHPCQDPTRNHPHQGHHRRSPARRSNSSKRVKPREPGKSSARNRWCRSLR